MYGRGVAVSKSDIATYTYALLALKASNASLRGAVELHFTYDEEVGGAVGPAWLLAQRISRPDFAFSAGFAYGITTAHNGCLHLEVEIVGRSAHAARPDTGVDALEAATGVLGDLYAIRRSYSSTRSAIEGIGAPTLTVGLIAGGINTNVVPDKVTFRIDRRIIPEEDPADAEATLTRQIRESAAKWPGITCTVRRILLAVPFVPIPGQEKLVEAIARHATPIMGEEVKAARRADLHGCAALFDRGHSDGALRRRTAYAARGERPPRRREAEARRSLQGDAGRGAGLSRTSSAPSSCPLARRAPRASRTRRASAARRRRLPPAA